MIANKEVKRTFKIILDSHNIGSYDGNQFNANYIIDLTHIIFDNAAYNKPYYMTCTYRSRSDTIANNGITSNNVYSLHIDMGKGLNIYKYRQTKNPSFLVPVSVSNETATPQTYFDLTDDLADPVFIQDINNMNYITLNLINTTNNATFTGSGVDANLRYVCILTFTEA